MTRPSSVPLLALALLVASLAPAPALAQTPTAAQQQAIRSNCVSDYQAHCSTVPTGGMDALVCLEQNLDSLSPACKSAVEAVDSGAGSGTAAAPAPSASATDTATPSDSAASPQAPGPDSAAADTATSPPSGSDAPAASVAAPSAAVPPAPAASQPVITFRQEMRIAAGACAVDFRLLCPNLPVGHGNVLFCLRVHEPRLHPACREALVAAGVRF